MRVLLQIVIAVLVTLLVNWASFMEWATSSGRDMAAAAEGIAGRELRRASCMAARPDLCSLSMATVAAA